jgi:hypothetical protein
MRKKGYERHIEPAGKTAARSIIITISPSALKVNDPILLISLPFAAVLWLKPFLLLERFPLHWECLRLPRVTRTTIGHEQNTSRMPRLRPL